MCGLGYNLYWKIFHMHLNAILLIWKILLYTFIMFISNVSFKVIFCLNDLSNDVSRVFVCMHDKLFWLCSTLCDPMDCSLSGSSVHGILQARWLEWVTMPYSRGSSWPGESKPHPLDLLHWQAGSLPPAPLGKPQEGVKVPFNIALLSILP